jgi:hypothetical protein
MEEKVVLHWTCVRTLNFLGSLERFYVTLSHLHPSLIFPGLANSQTRYRLHFGRLQSYI